MSQSEPSLHDDRVNEAIAAYLQAVERGEDPDREKFLAEHAEIAAELKSFFANQSQFRQAAGEHEDGISEPRPSGSGFGPPLPDGRGSMIDQIADQPNQPAESPANPDEPTLMFQERRVPSPKHMIRYFGDYELLEEIARGGMGVVFKARQVKLNRVVAVKMILAGSFAGPEDVQRFHTEAEAAAQLDHPGIVPIYEVGEHDGQHYFSMGFVEGQSLAKRVAEGPLEPHAAAEMVKTVAEAVQYAHDKGVIHRDLKPGNILLDKDGKPRVTDFGLAKLTESASDLTGTGQILGTPSYMPPEQAAAQVSAVGRLSDVYSLGAILYCLLTGRPPFQAANPLETLFQVQRQEPVPPRQLNPNIPLDLDTIVLKCLDKSPSRRYASAKALAEELTRYLEGKPILARRVSRTERFWRWCQREPIVAGRSAGVVVALIVGTIISSYYAVLASNRADSENKAKGKAEVLAREKGVLADKNAALFESERDEKTKAQRQLRIATAERLAALSYTKRPESLDVGLLLAVESGRATRGADEGLLDSSHQALLDALSHTAWKPLVGHHAPISSVAISSDSRWIVTGSSDNTARIWDLTAENLSADSRVLSGHRGEISSVAISRDSRWIVTGSRDNTARVWDLTAEDPAATARVLDGHANGISSIAISPDSRWIVIGSDDSTASAWDLMANDPVANPRVLRGHQSRINGVAISPDSRWIVTGSSDNTARVWDLKAEDSDVSPRVLSGHQNKILNLAISPNSRWLVTGSSDNTARLWDLMAKDPAANPRVLRGHQSGINDVAISPDNRWIVTASEDKTVRIWLWSWDDLVELAGDVGRNFSSEEWEQYFPQEPYRKTFPELPIPGP